MLVFNKVACPDYAAVESTFSVLKAHARSIKQNKLANGKAINMADIIDESFDRISKDVVRR